MTCPPGTLYLVATPIGNLDDLGARAARILREVRWVAAEDTRTARKVLAHAGARATLVSLHAHSSDARLSEIVARLRKGESVAVVSDAGAPSVSDPGAAIAARAYSTGVPVVAVPGPSALTAALVASGLACNRFAFLGFLPRAAGPQRKRVAGAIRDGLGLVFFESPRRLTATLRNLAPVLGARPIAVCREMTKIHEQIVRGTTDEVLQALPDPVLGEVTVVVAEDVAPRPTASVPSSDASLRTAIRAALREGASVRDAAARAAEALGRPRREAYQLALQISRHARLGTTRSPC